MPIQPPALLPGLASQMISLLDRMSDAEARMRGFTTLSYVAPDWNDVTTTTPSTWGAALDFELVNQACEPIVVISGIVEGIGEDAGGYVGFNVDGSYYGITDYAWAGGSSADSAAISCSTAVVPLSAGLITEIGGNPFTELAPGLHSIQLVGWTNLGPSYPDDYVNFVGWSITVYLY